MTADLVQEAQSRGLALTTRFLADNPVGGPADPDPALAEPLATEPMAALQQMVRRGLHPELVSVVFEWLADRPLERGLFAWDVLCGALLGPDDVALLEALREAAKPIREVVPAIGEGYIYTARTAPEEMVERLATAPFRDASDEVLQAGFVANALGAVDVLRREMGQEHFKSSSVPQKLCQFAKSLNGAHLSTLASFYFAYLWKAFDFSPALAEYADVLLDADAKVGLPRRDHIFVTGAPEEVDVEAYIVGRTMIRQGRQRDLIDGVSASPERTDYSKESPSDIAKGLVRAHVVLAEAGMVAGELTVPLEVVAEIVRQKPGWRYAARVLTFMVASLAEAESDAPLSLLDEFLSGYGNDGQLWLLLARHVPEGARWWDGVQARAVREVTMLPHDRQAWAGLIAVSRADKSSMLLDELVNRAAWQCPRA